MDLGVLNRCSREQQRRPNVISRQFRIAPQQVVPGLIICELIENDSDWKPSACNDRFPAAPPRVNLDSVQHSIVL
jgi:hypothetical protein